MKRLFLKENYQERYVWINLWYGKWMKLTIVVPLCDWSHGYSAGQGSSLTLPSPVLSTNSPRKSDQIFCWKFTATHYTVQIYAQDPNIFLTQLSLILFLLLYSVQSAETQCGLAPLLKYACTVHRWPKWCLFLIKVLTISWHNLPGQLFKLEDWYIICTVHCLHYTVIGTLKTYLNPVLEKRT